MKIQEFRARNVFGYLNLGVMFDKNPHILIAPNGAGKTTALRLMQALITPSLRDLLLIDFQDAFVRLDEIGGQERVVYAKKTKTNLLIGISSDDNELSIPLGLLDAIESELPPQQRVQESSRALRLKYADDPVYNAISAISLPVFLGLDRRNTTLDEASQIGADDLIVYKSFAGRSRHDSRATRGGAVRRSF